MKSDNQQLAFRIHGMDCGEEVAILKRELAPMVDDQEQLAFDILNGKMTVTSDGEISSEDVIRAVAGAGMRAEVWRESSGDATEAGFWERNGRAVLTTASGAFGLAGFLTHAVSAGSLAIAVGAETVEGVGGPPPLSIILYVLGIAAGFWHVAPKAWLAVIRLRPDMNLLMFIAVLGAAAIGEWLEATMVAFLFSFSLLLESWSVGRARQAVAALMDLAPPTARVRDEMGNEKTVSPDQVSVGVHFVVRPAERIPLDGEVVRGVSDVNQAPITGESAPVPKREGAAVFAGTINGDGVLEVRCAKPASDTTLAHIIRLVGEAQSRRAPSEQWVDKFARIYTPAVMALAAAVLLAPPLLFGGQWLDWIYRSLVLLVIACPCALVISTPVSVVAALAAAARNGVLIKGGLFVETPSRLKAMAIDKTGTITEGKPSVVSVTPLSGHDESEVLQIAAALESHSNHPLARAIVAAAKEKWGAAPQADDVESIQGKGAVGRINGESHWLGSHRYLKERGQQTAEVQQHLESMQKAGRSIVAVGNDRHVCGLISLADQLRPSASETLEQLRAAGVAHLIMLTGDNEGTAAAIASEAGIDEVHAELLPEDKVKVVETLVEKHHQVAMIGDGVNDAPALGRASLGIAMGAAGSDAAIETADIALMTDDLSKLPWLINHSRRTVAIIRQNIAFSLAIKALFVILTFAGLASLWAAIAADMGASLLVICNGLRLLNPKTA